MACIASLIMLSSWLFLTDPAFPEITDHEDQFPSLYGEIPLFEIDFEDPQDLEKVRPVGRSKQLDLAMDESFAHSGRASMRLGVTDPGGAQQLNPSIEIELSPAIPASEIMAISCWVHVPAELADHFYGRYDARIFVNGRNPRWSKPAIEPGWTHLSWEFSNLYEHPLVHSIRLQFGPILPGFDQGAIHVDDFVLEGMESVGTAGVERLLEIAGDRGTAWSQRFQAIRKLGSTADMEAIPSLFEAVADGAPEEGFNPMIVNTQVAYINEPPEGSEAVRSAAKTAIGHIARQMSVEELPQLRSYLGRALGHADGRIRLAAVQTLLVIEPDPWVMGKLEHALLDDLYYTREAALEGLNALGHSPSTVAPVLAEILLKGDPKKRIGAARCLSEIGTPAQSTMPEILAVLRDPEADQQLRLWCLRAAWWTDESVLQPQDWVHGLYLQPGEIHRHLLNRAMDRLQQAGPAAIPALSGALASSDPEVRARAATLLNKLGAAARPILETVQNDTSWYVQAAAGYPTPLPDHHQISIKVEKTDNRVRFSNGLIEIEFDLSGQDPGPSSARLPGGKNMIDSAWLYKLLSFKDTKAQSIIERVWFQKIHGVPLDKNLQWELGESTDDQAEMVCRYPGSEDFPLEWEFHYVLRQGDSGFYSYMVVRNVAGRELPESTTTSGANSIGMINQLVAPTWNLFETAVMHDNFKWPASFHKGTDFSLYPDIYQATYRMPDGQVDAKHEGSNHELNSPVTGYAGPHGGFWQILPSLEFCGAFWPWDQRTSVNHNMFVLALENKYYVPTGVRLTDGWEKLYGPIFFYLNQGENTEEMWADAKRRAATEEADWPYRWLDQKDFHQRGTVTGTLRTSGTKSPKGAWALLALPDDDIPDHIEFGEWWRDIGSYHYHAAVEEDGSFEISNVRSGTYDLFIWHEDIYGEYRQQKLSIQAGEKLEVGECVLTTRDTGHLLWQIGDPNRTMTEFKNGGNYHQWDTYLRYRDDFPTGMHFKIGQSDPAKDWNYLQPAIVQGESEPTSAVVSFEFDASLPGNPMLTVVAGGRSVNMEILVNAEKIGDLKIDNIGLQHIRTVPYGELTVHRYHFDRSLLHKEGNQLTLRFAGTRQAWGQYIAYDFLRIELVP